MHYNYFQTLILGYKSVQKKKEIKDIDIDIDIIYWNLNKTLKKMEKDFLKITLGCNKRVNKNMHIGIKSVKLSLFVENL